MGLLLWQCAIPDRAGPIVSSRRPFRSLVPDRSIGSGKGKKSRRREGKGVGETHHGFSPPRIQVFKGRGCSNAIVPFCSFARRMLRRLAHAHARAYNTYVTHTRARVYTTQDTTRDERRDASCALTLAVDERRPRWIKKERVGEGK